MKGIQVITGCMFAGKTTELLNRLNDQKANHLLIKPLVDNRDDKNTVSTHNGVEKRAIAVSSLSDIFHFLDDISLIGIDEAQFFTKSIIDDLRYLQSKNIKIIIAGLDKDYLNQPFGLMQEIIKISDSVTRLTANCNQCGKDANYSHRKNTSSQAQFLIGNENFYEALCEICFHNK